MNRGAHLLQQELGDDLTLTQLAEKLGTHPGTACHWLQGNKRPVTRMRMRIQDLFRIPWQAWDEEAAAEGDAA